VIFLSLAGGSHRNNSPDTNKEEEENKNKNSLNVSLKNPLSSAVTNRELLLLGLGLSLAHFGSDCQRQQEAGNADSIYLSIFGSPEGAVALGPNFKCVLLEVGAGLRIHSPGLILFGPGIKSKLYFPIRSCPPVAPKIKKLCLTCPQINGVYLYVTTLVIGIWCGQ